MENTEQYLNGTRYRDMKAFGVADSYLKNEIDIEEAINGLKRSGFGKFLIGEIAIEQSSQVKPSEAPYWLRVARGNYNSVIRSNDPKIHLATKSKAELRIAQLSLFREVNFYERLPNHDKTYEAYKQILGLSKELLDYSSIAPYSKNNVDIEIRGIIGEAAVLLMLQRFSMREMPEATWAPLQSYFSEDHGGTCISKSDKPSWDINIFTQLGRDEPIEKTYQIQVKNIKNLYSRDCSESQEVIYIREDLRLSKDEKPISSIIHSLDIENERPDSAERITKMLDERTEKMLDKIDSF